MNDWELLEQYRLQRSQDAFARLVDRHAGLVYGVCRRRLRESHLAEDVTQAVFVLLARRPPKRRGNSALAGWLYQTAVYACMNMMRSERIRRTHEREFAQQQATAAQQHSVAENDRVMALEEALSELSARDRDALLLRYYQDMNLREVGGALGISEDAASKRLTRAIDRLRSKMDWDITAPAVGSMLAEMTRCASPSGLASSLIAVATTQAAASGAVTQIVEGVLIMTRHAQLKLAGLVAGIAVLGGGVVTTVATLASREAPTSQVALAAPPATQLAPKPSAEGIRRAKELQRQGWALWQQQSFEDAAEKFQESIDLVATDPDAWNGLGWTRFNSGDPDAGKIAFEKCVALNAVHPAGLNGLGQIALARGQFDEAEKQFLKCADRASAAAYGLARIYLLQGKWTDAEKWMTKFLNVEKGASNEINARMLTAAKEKKLDDDLRAMIAPEASSEASRQVMRAFTLMNQGKVEDAKQLFDEALAQAPDDPDVLNGVGWYQFRTGDVDGAKSMFELALQHAPSHTAAMNGLAQCYREEGRIDEAIALWEQMMKSAPHASAGMYSLAQLYLERGDFDKALPLWEKLAKQMPQNEQVQASLAAAREGAKK